MFIKVNQAITYNFQTSNLVLKLKLYYYYCKLKNWFLDSLLLNIFFKEHL